MVDKPTFHVQDIDQRIAGDRQVELQGYAVSGGKKSAGGPLALKRELRELTAKVNDRERELADAAGVVEALESEIAELSERGFDWLSHYSSVDPMHDVYGIEVCGILDENDAHAIRKILVEMFPDWTPGCLCYKDYGREPGWKAKVQRDRDRPDEQWETA